MNASYGSGPSVKGANPSSGPAPPNVSIAGSLSSAPKTNSRNARSSFSSNAGSTVSAGAPDSELLEKDGDCRGASWKHSSVKRLCGAATQLARRRLEHVGGNCLDTQGRWSLAVNATCTAKRNAAYIRAALAPSKSRMVFVDA